MDDEDEPMPIFRKTRLSTGISDLDIVLEGGYPNPATIMVLGPSGIEKSLFAFHFAAGKKPDETRYFVTADAVPESILEKSAASGIPLSPSIKFIDCYSSTLGKEQPGETKHALVPGPGALNDLSLALNDAMRQSQGKRMRVVFYSLSTFMLYNPKDSILKFLQVVGGRLKKAGATVFMVVEEGVHDPQLLGAIEHTMDEVYAIRSKPGGGLELIVPGVSLPLPFKVGTEGISIL